MLMQQVCFNLLEYLDSALLLVDILIASLFTFTNPSVISFKTLSKFSGCSVCHLCLLFKLLQDERQTGTRQTSWRPRESFSS